MNNQSRAEISAEMAATTNEPTSGVPYPLPQGNSLGTENRNFLTRIIHQSSATAASSSSLPTLLAQTLVALKDATSQVVESTFLGSGNSLMTNDSSTFTGNQHHHHYYHHPHHHQATTSSNQNNLPPLPMQPQQQQQHNHQSLLRFARFTDQEAMLSLLQDPQQVVESAGSSLSQVEKQQQPFSDRWSDYWSREPFPSGYTQSSVTLLACLITTIIFLIVVGNLLVCIAIFTEKSLKPTQNWFIASLAVSDMMLGLVVMPFSLARELMGFWVFGQLWCDIHEAIDVLLTTASINTLCLISLDRYWSITQAVNYLKKRTPRRGAFMIAFVWFFSAAVSLPPLFGWRKPPSTMKINETILVPVQSSSSVAGDDLLPAEPMDEGTTPFPSSGSSGSGDFNEYLSSAIPGEPMSARQTISSASLSDTDRESTDLPDYKTFTLRRRRRYRERNLSVANRQNDQLATPPSDAHKSRVVRGEDDFVTETRHEDHLIKLDPTGGGPISFTTPPLMMTTTVTREYPLCQLSDDIGYVLYSALGSFFIPCAVMVFTYIKIFLAARSRARRAISKQSRSAQSSKKGRGTRRPANNPQHSLASSGPAVTHQASTVGAAQQPDSNASAPGANAGTQVTPTCSAGMPNPPPRGKIVIVERRKSLAVQQQVGGAHLGGATYTPTSSPVPAAVPTIKEEQKLLSTTSQIANAVQSVDALTSVVDPTKPAQHSYQQQQHQLLISSGEEQFENSNCTLTTSGVRQASRSCLNSSPSNDSSMITVMNASMGELPVTRFTFHTPRPTLLLSGDEAKKVPISSGLECSSIAKQKQLDAAEVQAQAESLKAAALLRAISQVGGSEQAQIDCPHLPDIQVVGEETTETRKMQLEEAFAADADQQVMNATNETCFMTMEEDSDMFDAQTGRTIVLVANAHTKSHAYRTFNPTGGNCSQDGAICRRRHAQSASSYCGSSLTMNEDEDLDGCVDDEGEDDDEDDELLTDDCNGYSISCNLDQYSSSCPHCQLEEDDEERDDDQAGELRRDAEDEESSICQLRQQAKGSPNQGVIGHPSHGQATQQASPKRTRLSPKHQHSLGHHHHHHHHRHAQPSSSNHYCQHREQTGSELEAHSLVFDDNLSAADYDSSSSSGSGTLGHDVLDATERPLRASKIKRKSSQVGQTAGRASCASSEQQAAAAPTQPPSSYLAERKKSYIGLRLSRLASGSPLTAQAGGLLDLASQQSVTGIGNCGSALTTSNSGGPRNLKALRQNFFMKLNQLTAKSATKQQEGESKSSKKHRGETSPTGKSSARSSGTSFEPSVDCATTSNIHSADYPPETTTMDESNPSDCAKKSTPREAPDSLDKDDTTNTNVSRINLESDMKSSYPSTSAANQDNCLGKSINGSKVDNIAAATISGDKNLVLLDSPLAGQLDNKNGQNLSQLNSNNSILASPTNEKLPAKLEADQQKQQQQQQQLSSRNKTIKSAGNNRLNHTSSTVTNLPSGNQSSVTPGSVTNKAYLASDNERHKRKLAKARERRATLILGLIMAAFICSWLPFFTFYVTRALCYVCRDYISPRFESFIFWMGYCNSAINPIIYTIFNRDFRKAFRKILFKCL